MYHTVYDYRITPVSQSTHQPTWLFLPGGPGIGSAYLSPFVQQLNVPGTKLIADFPADGSNDKGELYLKSWNEGLLDLVRSLNKPILVTHDFSTLFALNNPELEPHLGGIILMNGNSENSFVTHINHMRELHQLPDLAQSTCAYHLNPITSLYKAFWQVYKFYYFSAEELGLGEQMMAQFKYNNSAYYYGLYHFYPQYQCRWLPTIPAMTIGSEHDYICPPHIFIDNQAFQQTNFSHYLIENAGHCPWLKQLPQVQRCFDAFISSHGIN
ncbi:MAG: alpha/beta hydrolase [Legionella sp.]